MNELASILYQGAFTSDQHSSGDVASRNLKKLARNTAKLVYSLEGAAQFPNPALLDTEMAVRQQQSDKLTIIRGRDLLMNLGATFDKSLAIL